MYGWIIHSELRVNIGLLENNLKIRLFTADKQKIRLLI